MKDDQKSAVPKPPSADDLKLKEIIRNLADEAKPEAIRFLKRLVREVRS